METVIQAKTLIPDVKAKMSDILVAISWREIARTYFGKSSSWLYHKLDGIDGNGGAGGFTPDEARHSKVTPSPISGGGVLLCRDFCINL